MYECSVSVDFVACKWARNVEPRTMLRDVIEVVCDGIWCVVWRNVSKRFSACVARAVFDGDAVARTELM